MGQIKKEIKMAEQQESAAGKMERKQEEVLRKRFPALQQHVRIPGKLFNRVSKPN